MVLAKILLVDDEPDIRTVAEMSLTLVGGWSVTPVASGPEALEAVGRERPDLVLLDVMMAGMSGPETFRGLQERFGEPAIPVIFMTAKVQNHEVQSYLALGALGVVHKPFDPMRLPAQIQRIVAGS